MSLYLIGIVIVGIVAAIYFMGKNNSEAETLVKNDKEKFSGNSISDLENKLAVDGFAKKDNGNYQLFTKKTDEFDYEIEIFKSRKKIRFDIDVKNNFFNLNVPANIKADFFDRVIISGINQKLKQEKNLELLTDVKDGSYFLRNSIEVEKNNIPLFENITEIFHQIINFFREFPFQTTEDMSDEFFENIIADEYVSETISDSVIIRFQKVINDYNCSIYYSKFIELLLFVSTPLLENEIQDDFSVSETRVHQFLKKEGAENIFPDKDIFKEIEHNLTSPEIDEEE